MTFSPKITDKHRSLFDSQGFFVLDNIIPNDHLQLLRELSDQAVAARVNGSTVGTSEGTQLMGTTSGRVFILAWKLSNLLCIERCSPIGPSK